MKLIKQFINFWFSLVVLFSFIPDGHCQDTDYAKFVVESLCSPQMHGRGYVKHGDKIASSFIKQEFIKYNIPPITKGYFQPFPISINTFPKKMYLRINGKELSAGIDYIVEPSSGSGRGCFETYMIRDTELIQTSIDSINKYVSGKILVIYNDSSRELSNPQRNQLNEVINILYANSHSDTRAIIELTNLKLSFGASAKANPIPYFIVNSRLWPDTPVQICFDIENKSYDSYITRNVVAYIPGHGHSDSAILVTAHYDHLGMMGNKIYFPGANDNASGVAMMLTLARYFKNHPQPFSIVFIAFSAEEAGLLGSFHYTANPMTELTKIKYMINIDLAGNGEEGITIVNGSVHPVRYQKFVDINTKKNFLSEIKKRGEACNSDHCPFHLASVPAFFIYTMGGSKAYHDIHDRPESLTYKGFNGLKELLIEYIKN